MQCTQSYDIGIQRPIYKQITDVPYTKENELWCIEMYVQEYDYECWYPVPQSIALGMNQATNDVNGPTSDRKTDM